MQGIRRMSTRSPFARATSMISSSSPSARLVGSSPSAKSCRVLDDEVVLGRLLARIGDMGDARAGELGHELGQVPHPVRLGHLVEDLDPIASCRRVEQRQLDAADEITDVDEGAGLAAGAVDGEWMTNGGLDEQAVEHRAVVAVIVEPIDQPRVGQRLGGIGAPDDALVQVGDPAARRFWRRTRAASDRGTWSCDRLCPDYAG